MSRLLRSATALFFFYLFLNASLVVAQQFYMAPLSFTYESYPTSGFSFPARAYHYGAVDESGTTPLYYFYGGGTGLLGTGQQFNDLWVIDTAKNELRAISTAGAALGPARIGTFGGVMGLIGTNLFIFGGSDETTMYNSLWVYKSQLRTFERQVFSPLVARPSERMLSQAFVRRDAAQIQKMYVLGGISTNKYLNDLWEYAPASANAAAGIWTLLSTSVVPPLIRFQAVYDTVGDKLYVWHGIYEAFYSGANTTSNTVYQWTWSNPSDSTQGYWTALPMVTFPSLVDSCSWYINGALWEFGGLSGNVMSNELYTASLSSSPINFTLVKPAFSSRFPTDSQGVPILLGRRGHDCKVASSFRGLNRYNPGVIISAGITKNGPTNQDLWLDFTPTVKFYEIRPALNFPMARMAHISVLIDLSIILFGDDLWAGDFTLTSDGSDLQDMTWNVIAIQSPTKPAARYNHAASSVGGLLYMFGGVGTAGTETVTYSDLWSYDHGIRFWTLLNPASATGELPTARHGHSMETVGGLVWMFGGQTAISQSDELWKFDPVAVTWTRIKPAVQNALWPLPRAFHSTCMRIKFLTAANIAIIQNYIASISSYSLNLLAQFMASQFPPLADINADPVTTYIGTVRADIARRNALLKPLVVGSSIGYLFIFGGFSTLGGGSMTDMWIFDTLTQLWQVPGNYSALSDFQGVGRRNHVSRTYGPFIMQGGQDDYNLRPASPAIMDMDLGAIPGYSYPYTSFPLRTDTVLGVGSDPIYGGLPPTPPVFYPSFMVSMPPLIFGCLSNWRFPDGADFSKFYSASSNSLVFPSSSSWSEPGMVKSHSTVKISNSLVFIGGAANLPKSSSPTGVNSALTVKVTRAVMWPVCNWTGSTTVSSYYGGCKQSLSPTAGDTCWICSPGSYVNMANPLLAVCSLCPPGTYSDTTGVCQCTPCPPGFFSTKRGSSSLASCVACPLGQFNPQYGASSCQQCPAGSFCNVASKAPLSVLPAPSTQITQSQPQHFYSSVDILNTLTAASYAGGFGVLVALLAFFFISRRILFCRRHLRFDRVDFFYQSLHKLFTRPRSATLSSDELWREFYQYSWRTPLGGLCTIAFSVLIIIICCLLFLPFHYDNIVESQSLIPNLSMDPVLKVQLQTDLVFSMSLIGYGDTCSVEFGGCDPQVTMSVQNLYSLSGGLGSLSCAMINATCQITYSCPACKLVDDAASVTILLNQPLTYASEIQWSFSSTSGVQQITDSVTDIVYRNGGVLSRISGALAPPFGNLLRGKVPNVISVRMIASQYNSSVLNVLPSWQGTGFMLQYENQTLGQKVIGSNFGTYGGMFIMINITRAGSTFKTTQTIKQDAYTALSTLAGCVGAFYKLMGLFMNWCERVLYNAEQEEAAELGRPKFDTTQVESTPSQEDATKPKKVETDDDPDDAPTAPWWRRCCPRARSAESTEDALPSQV